MSDNKPPQPELKHYSIREIIQRMVPLVKPHRRRLLLASVLVAICGMAVASIPLFGKYVIDEAIDKHKSFALALGAMGVFLLVQFTRSILGHIAQVIITKAEQVVVFTLRSQGFRHVQRLCLRFHGKYPSGFLHDRVFVQSIGRVGSLVSFVFSRLALEVASFAFALIACLSLSVPMTAVILLGAGGYVFIARFMGRRIRERTIRCNDAHSWVCSYVLDKLQGHKTIQAYALEERVDKEFDKKVWQAQEKYTDAVLEQHRLGLWTSSVSHLLTASIYVLGTYAVLSWGEKTGTLVAFVGFQGQLIGIISRLTMVYGQLVAARTGFDQFYTVMDTQSTIKEHAAAADQVKLGGDVEFRNVSFTYEQDPVLLDTSFKVAAGQSVALVGRSGAGKTTVTNLLLRFYDPSDVDILVDDRSISEYALRPYRARFGVVLQDPFLFDDTIEHNLRCVRADATDDELRQALERASALEFVEACPDGLYHRVGERGTNLSGGQRQRIAIARAMLLDPDILILDEATAALDNEAESLVQHALEELFKDRTAFIIAHRLSTIRHVDRVLVFDAGRVAEDGSYEELLNKEDGLFRHLHDIATSSSVRRIKIEDAGFA